MPQSSDRCPAVPQSGCSAVSTAAAPTMPLTVQGTVVDKELLEMVTNLNDAGEQLITPINIILKVNSTPKV